MFDNLPSVKRFGIKISGGLDSALLSYMLAKHSMDNSLNLKIYPILILEYNSLNLLNRVTNIIKFIENKTNFKFENILTYKQKTKDETKVSIMRNFEKQLIDDKTVQYIVSGTTHVPKTDDFISTDSKNTPEDRSGVFKEIWEGNIYTPILNKDKREIAELYKKYNLMDSLFSITKSCVVDKTEYNHCGRCWWCNEREWAFGKL